jgi:hypothetical protein
VAAGFASFWWQLQLQPINDLLFPLASGVSPFTAGPSDQCPEASAFWAAGVYLLDNSYLSVIITPNQKARLGPNFFPWRELFLKETQFQGNLVAFAGAVSLDLGCNGFN